MKVEKKNKTESFYILIGYLSELIIKNLAIWNLIFLQNKSDEFRLIFFMKNPLWLEVEIIVFRSKFGEISPPPHQKLA